MKEKIEMIINELQEQYKLIKKNEEAIRVISKTLIVRYRDSANKINEILSD